MLRSFLIAVALLVLTTAAAEEREHRWKSATMGGKMGGTRWRIGGKKGGRMGSVMTQSMPWWGPYERAYNASREANGYESPLPRRDAATGARRRWFADMRNLVDFRIPAQEELWRGFVRDKCVTMENTDFLTSGGMFADLDKVVLYCLVRQLRPRRVLEIGAGQSTHVVRAALKASPTPCTHTVIEPYRADWLPKNDSGFELLQYELQELPDSLLSRFELLDAGDVLFIDSSHVTMAYGDTLVELISILPRLRRGVYIHIHDIFLPYDYPKAWATRRTALVYTEQWLLALMLWGAQTEWEVVWSAWLMRQTRQDLLLSMPHYPLSHPTGPNGASFWIRKLAAPRPRYDLETSAVEEGQPTAKAAKMWAERERNRSLRVFSRTSRKGRRGGRGAQVEGSPPWGPRRGRHMDMPMQGVGSPRRGAESWWSKLFG